jgi:hypothetical protein
MIEATQDISATTPEATHDAFLEGAEVAAYEVVDGAYRIVSTSSRELLVGVSSTSRELLVKVSTTSRKLLVEVSTTSGELLVEVLVE